MVTHRSERVKNDIKLYMYVIQLSFKKLYLNYVLFFSSFTYHGVWQEIMADAHVLDFKRMLLYYHWCFACCSFLNLLDINYEEGFCCAICGKDNSLHFVICDAKAPSFRQEHCSSLKSTYSSLSPSTVPRETGR